MADDAPTTPPVGVPMSDAEAAAKAARIAKGHANLLPPCKPGETRNPSGKNGRKQAAALIKWLEEPSTDPDKMRIERVWEKLYLAALKGSVPAGKVLVEQHGGRPKQQIDLSSVDGSMSPHGSDSVSSALRSALAAKLADEVKPAPEAPADDGAPK